MKRVLIIGASILQLPAIIKAKEMGYYVAVLDYNPKAVGIPYADEYFNISTIDVEGVAKAAQDWGADGIMTLATDMPMRAVAKACETLGLNGISYETAVKATDKGEMIKAFEAHGVAHPWYYVAPDPASFKEIADKVAFPCIMKPTDNAGSRGVVKCHDALELRNAYDYARGESRGGAVIVEECLEGPEFSVEVLVTGGVPHVIQITDKRTTGAPHFVEMGHSQPTCQNSENREKIRDLACRAVKAVGITTGPAHVEMILTDQGPIMVELGARLGGDCITTHLVPLSTGVDMVGATIRLACGEDVSIAPKWDKGAAIAYFDACNGVIRSIEGVEEARQMPGVKELSIVHQVGERIGEIRNSVDRIGFVIAQGETAEEAIQICRKAMQTVRIEISRDA